MSDGIHDLMSLGARHAQQRAAFKEWFDALANYDRCRDKATEQQATDSAKWLQSTLAPAADYYLKTTERVLSGMIIGDLATKIWLLKKMTAKGFEEEAEKLARRWNLVSVHLVVCWDELPTLEKSKSSMKYRKKPVIVEASQWWKVGQHPAVRAYERPGMNPREDCKHCKSPLGDHGWIGTLEGGHRVCPGDWIITGVKGEHYPCKPDIFEQTYEPAE